MRNVGELLEIENSAQFVLKGLSQLLLQPPARARKRPYRHMGSLCKMTTVVAVVFAALVVLFPGFLVFSRKGWGEKRQCYAAGELAELGQNSPPTWSGRRHAAKSHGRHYM